MFYLFIRHIYWKRSTTEARVNHSMDQSGLRTLLSGPVVNSVFWPWRLNDYLPITGTATYRPHMLFIFCAGEIIILMSKSYIQHNVDSITQIPVIGELSLKAWDSFPEWKLNTVSAGTQPSIECMELFGPSWTGSQVSPCWFSHIALRGKLTVVSNNLALVLLYFSQAWR